jgi:uncharacterized protein involved in type VI secretion and phage assembly
MDTLNYSLETQDQQTSPYFGKYRGIVTDNQDPSSQGRVRAKVNGLLGGVETGWALPALPYSGKGVGVYTVPAKGAGVWIEFEHGDLWLPIWSGCWWIEDQLPKDETGAATTPARKIIRTEKGLLLAMDDGGKTIALSDSDGNNLIKITVQQGQIKMQAATKVVVEAPQIELVQSATHPLVLGNELMNYLNQLASLFNSHTHVGQVAGGTPVTPAPPVPTFPPPTPDLLSQKVKCG